MDYSSQPQGVDVSHWNGSIDWPKLAADGVSFAYIKATQGMGVDPTFDTNRRGAEAAGIIWMPYPFLTADDDDAVVQHFAAIVGHGVPAVLDWEAQDVGNDVVATWITGLTSETDRIPMAYYGLYPPDDVTPLIANCPRILPEYAPAPRLQPWDGVKAPDWTNEWLIWQRSEKSQFAGETGNFDLDVLAIDLDRFKTWYLTGQFGEPPTS